MKRRKPKRKQRLEDTARSGTKLGYAKYRVEWFDIASDSGWASEHQFDEMKLATPVSEGWLYSKDECVIKLFSSYDKDECVIKIFASYDTDEDGMVFGERTIIPISCVKRMKKIK